jgi:hypothetical protein
MGEPKKLIGRQWAANMIGCTVGAVMSSHPETFPCKPAYELKREDELSREQLEAYEFWRNRP